MPERVNLIGNIGLYARVRHIRKGKKMKRYLKQFVTFVLCLTMCMGNMVAVSAANENNERGITFTAELDTPSVTVSDTDQTVVMRIKAEQAVAVNGIGFDVVWADGLTIAGITGGEKIGAYDASGTNLANGKAAWGSADASVNVEGVTELAVITFTVPANTPAGSYAVGFENLELTEYVEDLIIWEDAASARATLTVKAADAAEGYTAGILADSVTVEKGEQVSIRVSAAHATQSKFNADELTVSYDKSKLTLAEAASTLNGAEITVDAENGKLQIANYGEDRDFGNIYTLAFDAIETGSAKVTLDSAAFIDKAGASQRDLVAAAINPGMVNLTINEEQFEVTLPAELEGLVEGAASVTAGSAYEFKVLDTNYTYEFSATIGGQEVTVTSEDGVTFTVEEVTGDMVITLDKKTPKSYAVTIEGNGAADVTAADGSAAGTTATYNTPYAFKINMAEGYGYKVSMTINGEAYTGYIVSTEDNVYTIPGAAITGAIAITVEKTLTEAIVSVTGEGAGIADGYETVAEVGKAYTLTVVPEAGYIYTVTATMGGKAVELTKNADGTTYTTPAVTGNIVFTIDRIVNTEGVKVNDKVNVSGGTVYAVSYETKLADNKVPTYDGNPMYWSENHQAYIYLTIAGTLSEDAAKAVIGITEGTPVTVADSSDVNGSGKLDASDAQYVWNMYNAQYSQFTADVTMIDFIKADRNADYKINTEDAAAIVNEILGVVTE